MKTLRRTILILLCLLLLPVPGAAEESDLRITPPEGREDAIDYLTDGKLETRLTLENRKSVVVEWDVKDAVSLLICWYEPAPEVFIEVLDETGTAVARTLEKNTPYRQQINVTAGCAVRITSQRSNASIAELRLFRAGEVLPYTETDVYEADLLIICAGMTEECRLLGGLIPLYTREHNIRTAVVFIRYDYGYVTNEGLQALTVLGFEEYPILLGRDDQNAITEERVKRRWRDSLTMDIWQIIRQVKPKVIVTLDPDDETQPARTRVAAKTVREVVNTYITRADVPVQKVYVLSSEGKTVMNWKVPLSAFDGRTAYDVACKGLLTYDSQRLYGYSVAEQSRFTLIYSAVGEDTRGDDLFEHIDAGTLASYSGATPLPLPTPAPTPEAPTAGTVSDTQGPKNGGHAVLALAAVCALLAAARKKKRAFAASALICLLLLGGNAAVRADETPAQVPAAEEASADEEVSAGEEGNAEAASAGEAEMAPEEASAPKTASTEAGLPAPSDDYWYRQPDDPAEVILSDYTAGHWEYRNDYLSIIIDRETFTLDGHPQCIYVAFIRSREIDSFHCGLVSSYDSTTLIMPWRLARTYKAVLAITGDNLTNAEKSAKGILIRNGVFYCDYKGEDTLVVYSSQRLGLVKKGTVTGLQLLDSGVKNSYSFGPILVENGEVNPDVSKHRVAKGNPRCGVGMIEEGCLIAIVADGRDPKRAYNLTLEEFAQIFKDKGAVLAYNLDGGNSAAMIFMGESISCHSGKSGQRTWIDSLMWGYSDQVPGTGDPVFHNGEGKEGYY